MKNMKDNVGCLDVRQKLGMQWREAFEIFSIVRKNIEDEIEGAEEEVAVVEAVPDSKSELEKREKRIALGMIKMEREAQCDKPMQKALAKAVREVVDCHLHCEEEKRETLQLRGKIIDEGTVCNDSF